LKGQGKQERSRQTIRTILDAAILVLIDEGFERSTTNRIASRAGYSVGTLYQYFDDKDDIYGTIVDEALMKLTESTSNVTIQPTLIETLRTWLELVLASLEQDPATIQALITLINGRYLEKQLAMFDDLVASTARLLEAHRDVIVVDNLELAAGVIIAATSGLTASEIASVLESQEMVQHILRLQFAYLTLDAEL
jgi:AcrR family transcriptional regulator